jgi:uncharacterized FlaG/YvyC family protein
MSGGENMSEIFPDAVNGSKQASGLRVERQLATDVGSSEALQRMRASNNGATRPSEMVFEKGDLEVAAADLSKIVKQVADTDLSFSIEDELSRMVVTVRVVGSDEIIRQFPPEEFLTVAKFIADQDVSSMDSDFLKGVLFDQRA